MKKIAAIFFTNFLLFFLVITPAFAHVVVKPNTANVGAFQTFTVGVPNEKDIPTTGLRLVIPEGLNYVSPNVKPGWTIEIKKSGEGEDAKVTEINWTTGSIPTGQRDDFLFSAQVPANETTVIWKAYQTYENGDVVAWDQEESKEHKDDSHNAGPFSKTKIINDLASTKPEEKPSNLPLQLSVIALALSAVAVSLQLKKKK